MNAAAAPEIAARATWDAIFLEIAAAAGCRRVAEQVLAHDAAPSYEAGAARFPHRQYVMYLAEACGSKLLMHPEMDKVAGNLLAFYSRWRVYKLNAGELHAVRTRETSATGSVMRTLERRYILGESADRFPSSIPRLYGAGLVTERFHSDYTRFGPDRVDRWLYDNADAEYGFNYVAMKTLFEVYAIKDETDGDVAETALEVFIRCALHVHGGDRPAAVSKTFADLAGGRCTFATPILVNSGLARSANMSSCFLVGGADLSDARALFATVGSVARCLDNCGGVGLSLTHYNRARYGGIMSLMKVLNETVNTMRPSNGGRPGAVAVYLEPWHPDVLRFLDARKNQGDERQRCRDLFTALWVPDIFMKRVRSDGVWSLFDPEGDGAPLLGLHGAAFEARYTRLESEGLYVAQTRARAVWAKLLKAQIGTGTPYMVYKDAAVGRSPHRSLGPVNCSNLCAEVIQYSDANNVATCKLASVCLPAFLSYGAGGGGGIPFDWDSLRDTVTNLVESLNRLHDRSAAVENEEKDSAAIGIGVQGLADVFMRLDTHWGSPLSYDVNNAVFERLYYYALAASCEQAKREKRAFGGFETTDLAVGRLQFDYAHEHAEAGCGDGPKPAWLTTDMDWTDLRADIKRHGLYNSLVVALMPTVTTSQITGNSESIEPYISNMYVKRAQSGEYQMMNPHLVSLLRAKNRFDAETVRRVQENDGSVQSMTDVFDSNERKVFRTAWEIPARVLICMAALRGRFVDQSQSMNLYMADPDAEKLEQLHFFGWNLGLKTGMYYLRTRPAASAIKFTIMPTTAAARDGGPTCSGCSA